MKVCPSCGFHNADDAMFCEECGAKLNPAPAGNPQPGPAERPPVGSQTGPQGGAQNQTGAQSGQQGGAQSWNDGQAGTQSAAKGWSGGQSAGKGWSGGAAPVQRPRKPMKKPGKNHIIAAVEALALVIAIVVFCVVGSSRTSPTYVAEQYCRAVLNGDWERICQLADVPDSPFQTREAFDRYLEEYEIYQRELANLSACQERDYEDQGTMGDYIREVEVEFVYRDSPEVYTEDMTLMRGDSRELFFFQGWKVVDNMPFLARGFQVEVPTGATLVVDGLVADESMCVEHRESTDLYRLDLFVGSHDFTVVTPLGSQSQTYTVWNDDDYLYAGDVAMTENLQNQLEGQTKSLLEQLLNAALSNSDFSAISGSYTGQALESQMPELYNEILEDFYGNENWRVLKVTLSNFEVWDCYAYYDEQGQLRTYLELEFDSTIDYARLENAYLDSTDSDKSYGAISLEFVYQDGSWIPTDVWNLYW